jgi:hypothetical protein
MGFIKRQRGGGNFYTIMQGKLVTPCEEDDKGAVKRVNKNGKTVWEKHKDGFEGHMTNAKYQKSNDKKFPDKINITLRDKESKMSIILSLPVDSNYASTFFQVMKNIDLRKPVAFEPYYYIKKEDKHKSPAKYTSGVGITQNGEKLDFFWERDEVPQWKKITDPDDDDKVTWSKTKQMKFFTEHFNKWAEENFKKDDEDEGHSSNDEDEDEDEQPKKSSKANPQHGKPKTSSKKSSDDDDDELDGDDF